MKILGSYKDMMMEFVNEADESDKYTHIGYGKYKLKGKEDDENAETFTKDDSGKFTPTGDNKDSEKPKGQGLSGGDFDRSAGDNN